MTLINQGTSQGSSQDLLRRSNRGSGLLAAAPPASCSLVPVLLEQLFCTQIQLLGALGAERPTMPAQLRAFPLDQRVLTLPGDTLSWKAYQDALLSIAQSHPLHRKASKSP